MLYHFMDLTMLSNFEIKLCRKMIQMILFQSRSRDTDVENTCMDTKGLECGAGGGGRIQEFGIDRHVLLILCTKQDEKRKMGEEIILINPLLCTGVLVTQSCPTLCDPMECSPQGSSVCGFLQARILEWVAIPFSRGCLQPGNQTQVACTASRFFYLRQQRSPVLVTALSAKLMLLNLNIKLRSISDALGIPATLHIILCLWVLSNICIG